MKFSTSVSFFLYALASTMGVTAAPAHVRRSGAFASGSSFSSGAAYFMTNMESGNTLVTADIGSDGTLTLGNYYATGGFGQHGNAIGPDPLFSQGSVQVHQASGLLALVNSGSNTISLFKINPNQPSQLTQVGLPVPTGGEFPISVGFNPAGTALCVLNGGFSNGVQCYTVSNTTGLSTVSGSWRPLGMSLTTPPSGPAGSASQVIFTPDGQNVVAAMKGNPTTGLPGFLASWSFNGTALSPTFTRTELPTGAGLPFSLGPIPGQNALFATDAAVGTTIYDLSSGLASAFAAPRTSNLAISGQKAVCWQAFSNATKNFYVSDIMTNLITEVSVSSNLTMQTVTQYNTVPGSFAIDLEVGTINGNDYLYTLLPNVSSVHVMSLEAPGQASLLQVLDFSQAMNSAKVPYTGASLQGMAVYAKSS